MEELNNKITGNSLTAAEWNQQPSELQNIITDFGQVLSGADLNQVGKSIAGYVANGNFYNAGGTVDVITLSVIGSRQGVLGYSDGMEIAFFPVGNNTGAVTGEVGILGPVPLTIDGGSPLSTGELDAAVISFARYNSTSARFELLNFFSRENHAGKSFLSSATDSSLGTGGRTAATPSAVKAAFDLATANSKLVPFAKAKITSLGSILGGDTNVSGANIFSTGAFDVTFTSPFSSTANMLVNCTILSSFVGDVAFSIAYTPINTSVVRVLITSWSSGSKTFSAANIAFSLVAFDTGL